MKEKGIQVLKELGFNQLEAEVYTFLLAHDQMTAYKIGKALGKQTANTYKAIESLAKRGAVLIEEGERRLCRAVPINEFKKHLISSFELKATQAEKILGQLQKTNYDERVYRLESVSQTLGRCRDMLEERCTRIAVVDAFPGALELILPSIRAAVSKGIIVYLQAYQPVEIKGARVVTAALGDKDVLNFWQSEQLNVVIDGCEFIMALLDKNLEEVYQGVWSNSLYLSCILHAGLLGEHTIHKLLDAAEKTPLPPEYEEILSRHPFFINSDVPGQKQLLARYLDNRTGETS